MSYLEWRNVDRKIYNEFFEWIRHNQEIRMEGGLAKYKSEELGFQGDPLHHALEEILDALFYIFYAMRQRSAMETKVAELNQELKSTWRVVRNESVSEL